MHKILIVGAQGFIGSKLFNELNKKAGMLVEGTSRSHNSGFLYLDLEDAKSISRIEWQKYTTIIDCTGRIDYTNSIEGFRENVNANVLSPLNIIDRLRKDQQFVYLSTHVSQLSIDNHNAYSFSKNLLEKAIRILDIAPRIIVLRLPGIFSVKRKAGLMYQIKNAYLNNAVLRLNFDERRWHIMSRDRLIKILIELLTKKHVTENVVNIGYPLAINPMLIIDFCNKFFSKEIQIDKIKYANFNYIPELSAQEKYCKVTISDFQSDLELYLGNTE